MCLKLYNHIVNNGPKHALSNLEVDKLCNNRFKQLKYKGCYPSDKKPTMVDNDCCILNTDNSKGSGVHWIALLKSNGKIYNYDSFGRETSGLSKDFDKKWIETNDNREQEYLEMNCGIRSIAFLDCCDKFGIEITKKVI